jgi:glycosyltransferase involved in cell wall biosynthesis
MRSVVLVAPEFPPSNTAGAHRPRLFAKHLGRFGWTPIVLTIRRDRIEGPLDPALEQLLAPELEVIRTGAIRIQPIRLVGDLGLRSIASHARALASLARRGDAQALVLFGPPWFSFALGPLMRRRHGVPYVVDYIDPWISEWTAARAFPHKAWFHHRAAAAIEPAVLRSASHVTAVSPSILTDLQARYPWLDSNRLSAMPYGAEPDDLEAAERLGARPPDFAAHDGAVTIAFTGAVQPTGRPLILAVLRALRTIRDSGSPLGRRIRLRCYGTSNLTWGHGRFAVMPLARELGVDDIVSEIPERVPYLDAMAILRACDLVLVMGSLDAYYHASKLYPAIVSGRPILAICHAESSIKRVMQETDAGMTIPFNRPVELDQRVGDIARALEWLAGRPRRLPDPSAVERLTARASTAVLAGVLDRITGQPVLAEAM